MAGNVVLDREEVRSILSLYHLEDLEDFGGTEDAALHTTYWIRAGGRLYDLRITERKTLDDMVYEKDLLLQLRRAGLPVPVLVRNVARGTFTPWARRGRYVSLFEHMPGRILGRFEIRARHARTIGRVLGDLHRSASTYRRRRSNPWSLAVIVDRFTRLRRALDRRRLALRFEGAVEQLGAELERQEERLRASVLPIGATHGGLTLSRARFRRDGLIGVVEFEGACQERFVLDLACALSDWAWEPSPRQRGGPAGRFKLTKVRALLDGYQYQRLLTPPEREHLADELRFVAMREAIRCLVRHDLSRTGRIAGRPYRDHRHFTARLEALADGRAHDLLARAIRD